ncbi:MAG: hypothetical protein IJI45_01440 [Anaerolineaceae bacterium]|nr:hypothetical protein [Anaerolineaceae bacterium]
MIYQYELACKEAGLSEEQTAEIRKFFDAEKKRLSYDKKIRKEKGITFSYITNSDDESEETGDLDSRDLLDEDFDLEEIIIHKILLEQLHKSLDELSVEDREFLFAVFGDYGSARRYGKEHGLTDYQVTRKKARLLKKLREIFFKNS